MPALRVDAVNDAHPVLTPKLAILYAPRWPLQVRASVARGFHAPTPQELHEQGYGHGGRAYRFGNPDLEPERSTTTMLSLELLPGRPFELSLRGHYSRLRDMIVPVYEGPWDEDPTKDVWRRTNIAKSTVYGAEARARYRILPGLRLEGGYTWSDERDDSGRQLPYHPGSAAFFEASVSRRLGPRWQVDARVALFAAFDRSAWSWKPAAGAAADDAAGGTTSLQDQQRLQAALTAAYRDTYFAYVNAHNLLGQDLEYLDDAYTVLEGEPTFSGGLRCAW